MGRELPLDGVTVIEVTGREESAITSPLRLRYSSSAANAARTSMLTPAVAAVAAAATCGRPSMRESCMAKVELCPSDREIVRRSSAVVLAAIESSSCVRVCVNPNGERGAEGEGDEDSAAAAAATAAECIALSAAAVMSASAPASMLASDPSASVQSSA